MIISKDNFKKIITIGFLILLVLFFNVSVYLNYSFIKNSHNGDPSAESLRMSQTQLPDKVYTFLAPNDKLTFENLSLQGCYMYYIWIELVTPHDVSTMRIRIWDPENSQYNIFESAMFWDPEYGRYFEIPFGTALAGNYTVEFYVETSKNVNILVYIEQGPKCLHDKLGWQDIGKIIFYEVRKFHNEMYVEHELMLTTDTMYKYYFARVSAISIIESNNVYVDINITDAVGTEFEMYTYKQLQNIDGLNGFPFGTANGGTYTLKFKIYCAVDYVNIALAVIKDYTIGGAYDPNQTQPIPSNNTNNTPNITVFIPIEWTIGMLVFVGSCVTIPCVFIIYHRKKNDPNMYFKGKKDK